MSFFDDFPPAPEPPERTIPVRMPWRGPPPGWAGGWVPWHLVFVRSDTQYSVITDVAAYPTGVEFSIDSQMKPGAVEAAGYPMGGFGGAFRFQGPDGPRFGVGFADGRKAAIGVSGGMPLGHAGGEPETPVLFPQGGGGGDGQWRQRFWLWPLPPPGPLLFVSTWPAAGNAEHSVRTDAAELIAAAERAQQLWTVEGREIRGGWSSTAIHSASATESQPRPSHE